MKKEIIIAAVSFVAGAIVGGVTLAVSEKMKAKKAEANQSKEESSEDEESKDDEDPQPSKEADPPPLVEHPGKLAHGEELGINYTAYNKEVERLKYAAESEFPHEEDLPDVSEEINEEDFYETEEERIQRETAEMYEEAQKDKKLHEGEIKAHPVEEYWASMESDFPTDDHGYQEYRFFPEEQILSPEDNVMILEPIKDYVGDVFDRLNWWENTGEEEDIYIHNYPLELHMLIHKEPKRSFEDWSSLRI